MVKEIIRQDKAMQRQRSPFVQATEDLVEAVIQVENQQTRDHIIFFKIQVLGNHTGRIDQVPV